MVKSGKIQSDMSYKALYEWLDRANAWNSTAILPPYAKLEYCRPYRHESDDEIKYLEWSREGKIWSGEEVDKLADDVMDEVEQEIRQLVTDEMIPHGFEDVLLNQFVYT